MKGRNELVLNHATMIEALQVWADATFKSPPRVASVTQTDSGHTPLFTVQMIDEVGA